MRGLLVSNPNATTTTTGVTDVISQALSAELKLDIETTKRRDHAGFLAAGAVDEGYDVVIALGGDGTVNEVVQGVAGTDVRLAIIPGGSTNVWARTLGLPADPVEATSVVLRKLRQGQDRRVNLGMANGRYFAFTAGFGFDAEVVRKVEQRARMKRTLRQSAFLWCGVLAWLERQGRRARITATPAGGEPIEGLRAVVCCNSNPYTYLGRLPAQLCPQADLTRGLDLAGFSSLALPRLLRVGATALTSGRVDRLNRVQSCHDAVGYELVADRALPLQVDGEFIGDTDRVVLASVPHALSVVA